MTCNTHSCPFVCSTLRSQSIDCRAIPIPQTSPACKRLLESCSTSALRGAPLRAFTSRRTASRCRTFHLDAAAATYSKDTPHLQLATAKLGRYHIPSPVLIQHCLKWTAHKHACMPDIYVPCSGVDIPTFATKMYQWASTLTYQGRNMPFALPFRTDPLDTGFVVGTTACLSHLAAL